MQLIHSSSDQPLYEPGKPWAPPADLPQEHFAFLPGWFAHGYIGRGNLGYWDIKPPAAVSCRPACLPAYQTDAAGCSTDTSVRSHCMAAGQSRGVAAEPVLAAACTTSVALCRGVRACQPPPASPLVLAVPQVILHNVWMPGAVVWKSYPYKAAGL